MSLASLDLPRGTLADPWPHQFLGEKTGAALRKTPCHNQKTPVLFLGNNDARWNPIILTNLSRVHSSVLKNHRPLDTWWTFLLHPRSLTARPWKMVVGRRSFPIGARWLFRGELLNFGRVPSFQATQWCPKGISHCAGPKWLTHGVTWDGSEGSDLLLM